MCLSERHLWVLDPGNPGFDIQSLQLIKIHLHTHTLLVLFLERTLTDTAGFHLPLPLQLSNRPPQAAHDTDRPRLQDSYLTYEQKEGIFPDSCAERSKGNSEWPGMSQMAFPESFTVVRWVEDLGIRSFRSEERGLHMTRAGSAPPKIY